MDVQFICISTDYFLYGVYKMLSIKLAEEIVHQTMTRLHHNINVISPEGVILASGDKERIDSIHEGAIQVAKIGTPLLIDEELAKQYQNCKPGINMPIKYQDKILGVIGITGDPKNLQEIANLVQLTTEMMVHQVLTESESEWQRKNGDFIFKALIENETIHHEINERIHKLPFPMKEPFQILLIKQEGFDVTNSLSLNLENILYRLPALFGQLDLNEYYVLLCGCSVNDSEKIIHQVTRLRKRLEVSIGVGPIVHSLSDMPHAFNSAKATLTFSPKHQHVTFFEEVEIYTLLKGRNSYEVNKFLTRVLNNISEKMMNTLQVFFECNLQLNICAEELGIHRHTLTYRLNKIYESTGLHPQNFEDAFVLKLALMLYKQ